MTIIARVQKALEASGNKPLADELVVFIHKLVGDVNAYMGLHDKLRKTTAIYINTVQRRCNHHAWIVDHSNREGDPSTWGPEESISCVSCGHTVCDSEAAEWGRRVVRDQKWMYRIGGRRFSLSANIRKKLGDRLIVKEIEDESIQRGPGRAPEAASTGQAEAHQGGPRAEILSGDGTPVGAAGSGQGEPADAGELSPP